jgi:diaminopimelate decarboxylase
MDAGAYGFSMSSNYNTRPKIAEILVDQTDFKLIRQRETFDDLIQHEIEFVNQKK